MGRQPCCDKVGLKKGPWSADEDQKLVSFILQNGHCCWRAVPKLAGLLRCGKSCRLRWTNYLRPDLKRGLLSEAEEQLIIDLHARLGNKWSKIASQLPGRTDNEIKNYWNTHIKKKLKRMGIDPVTHQRIDSVTEKSLRNEETDCVSEEADDHSQKQKTEENEQPQQLLRILKKENSRNTSSSNNNEVSSSRSTLDSSVITTDDESNSKPPKSCKLPCILDDFLLDETATAKTASFYPDSIHHLSRSSSSSMNFVDSSAIAVPASSSASLEFISENPIFEDGLLDFEELAAGSEVSFDGLEQSQSQDLALAAALEQELSVINESCEELQLQEEQEQPAAAPPPSPMFESAINGGLESSTCTSPWAIQIPDMDSQLWQEDSYPFSAFPWDSSSSEAPMIHTTTSTPLSFH